MAKKRKKGKSTRIAAFAAILGIIAAGGAGTVIALNNHRSVGEQTSDVSTVDRASAPDENQAAAVDPANVSAGTVNGMTAKAQTLIEHYNSDYAGWITVPNTEVDYPIVVCENNDFYLNHGFDHQVYRPGTVFMDYRNKFCYSESEQSDNIILYGHNMSNNSMFGSLRKYRQDLEFYREAPFIEMESNYKKYTYVIFAFLITDGSASAAWRYWDMEDFESQAAFDDFVKTAREKSLVDVPVDVKYGDKLVTLSTCHSDEDDSRFIIIGRRLRSGETADSFAKAFAKE